MHTCISPRAADGVVFGLGAGAYGLIEVLYKGDTHPSMLVAGGICFLAMERIAHRLPKIPFLGKCLMSGAVVTGVELAFGCVFNLILKMDVWDYSHLPLNLAGQICPLFTLLWSALAVVGLPLSRMAYTYLVSGKLPRRNRNAVLTSNAFQ